MSSPTAPIAATPVVSPLPKLAGIIAAIGVFAGSLQVAFNDPSVAAVMPTKFVAAVIGICGFIALLSHSLTGTGGK